MYFIINLTDGKYYVGSAINFNQRWRTHKSQLNRNIHQNKYLQNAWNKHEEFQFTIVEITTDLYKVEQFWIDASNCCNPEFGYNLKQTAEGSFGYKHTDEARKKISDRNKLRGIKPPSPLGRKLSSETLAKMSASMRGLKRTDTSKMRKPKSKEHKENLSKSKKGIKLSAEHRAKISESGKEKNKWPCNDGNKCKCASCKEKRNEYYRNKYPLYKSNKVGSWIK